MTALAGSTDAGFIPRQLADIQKAINERLALVQDPVTGEFPFQNNSDDTITQQVVAILSEAMMQSDNAAAWGFLMRDPLSAVGAALSSLVQLNGITRNAGSRTIVPMILNGRSGTLIPQGTIFSDADGAQRYALNGDVVLPLTGTAVMGASCTEYGQFNPQSGTIVVIRTPINGLTSVVNGQTSSVGTDEETDATLRKRQQQSTSATSYRQIEAIRGAILNVEGVTFCRAYQNSDLEMDERSLLGKTLACVVVGGDSRDVAEAIFLRSPIGMRYAGDVSEVFFDDQNIAYPIHFSRPIERLIWVRITLEIVTDEGINIFPSNGTDLIREAILDFAQFGSSTCEPNGNPGFPPGQDIIISQLYTPINSIGGSKIVSVELAIDDGDYANTDIVIAWNEIGIFSEDRIQVVYQ